MTPYAVVFDLDGTLIDTMTSGPTAYVRAIRARGGPTVTVADITSTWHIGPTPAVLAHFLGRPCTPDDIECFYHHFQAAVATVQPFPGITAMLDALTHAGHPLGIVTSAARRATTLTLTATGLNSYFPIGICGDEVSRPKPAPEGLQRACRQLGVTTTATLYVGDADTDLQCAASAGAHGIHATWGIPDAPLPRHPQARHPNEILTLARQPLTPPRPRD